MNNKLALFRSLLFAALICLLVLDAFLWLAGQGGSIPEMHKEILLTGVLLWFIAVFLNTNRDDDWAGEL